MTERLTIQDWLNAHTSPEDPDDQVCELTLGDLRRWRQQEIRLGLEIGRLHRELEESADLRERAMEFARRSHDPSET